MTSRLAATIVFGCLSVNAYAQAAAPTLSRQQRDLLKAIVSAVDAGTHPEATGVKWQHHVLRASDGSHYVAFSFEPPADAPLPAGPALLYIRLATATPAGETRIAERSGVREWLAGSRTDPRLLPRSGIVMGEMPIMGPTGNFGARQPVSTGSNELKLMALERERAKKEQDERNKQRRARNEGFESGNTDSLPFEDFDLASNSRSQEGARTVTRALTAGPGNYDLYLAWADPSAQKPAATIRVVRKSLQLEPARTIGLITSGIILADGVRMRDEPYSPAEQASHPYSIGAMEIIPARSSRYAREDNLSLAVQVINAQPNDAGKPDVTVNFRIVRLNGDRESPVASLKPQTYNAETMPAEFDLRAGHPIFAAVTAPLATLTRGDYRMKIVVNDRIANSNATTETDFSVVGTPASLLAEAPPLGRAFRKEAVLEPPVLAAVVDALTPSAPSAALARAIVIAKSGKLADLLVEEPVPASEAGVRTALTGLALFSIGDASSAVQFQRALTQNAPPAPAQFLLGAARAMQSRDPDAIAAWQAAIATGAAPAITPQLLLEAYLRRNDLQRATELAASASRDNPAWSRMVASTHVAARRDAEAIALLETHLAAQPDDLEARWLLLQALYSQFVRGGKPAGPADSERFAAHAQRYIDGKGANAALAREWMNAISSV